MTSENRILSLPLHIVCLNPPDSSADSRSIPFGLQDKSQTLHAGHRRSDGALQFQCSIQVKRSNSGEVDFAGPYVHGTPHKRFLYLSLRSPDPQSEPWIRRLKISLSGINWHDIQATSEASCILEASVDGAKSGTVALLGGGWTVKCSS